MASLKEVKNRIASVRSTRQITSAMKMVASAKLHKAQGRIENMLPYQHRLDEMLRGFLQGAAGSGQEGVLQSPYMAQRPVRRVAIVAFASNTSLCGSFNANVARMLQQAVDEWRSRQVEEIHIWPVGRQVEEAAVKMGFTPEEECRQMAEHPSYAQAASLARRLMERFCQGGVDRVELIYYHFKSVGTQVPVREDYLPLQTDRPTSAEEASGGAVGVADYIVEPSVPELITALLPKVLEQKLYTVLADSNASEHAARTMAMQTATDNADELIQDLTRQYNKTRQQVITNELLDIIGGSMR